MKSFMDKHRNLLNEEVERDAMKHFETHAEYQKVPIKKKGVK